jgi:hypothetical protein
MNLTRPIIETNFCATATPTGTGVAGSQTLGLGEKSRKFATADVIGIAEVTSAAINNVATYTVSTGAFAQTTGSPVITDGDGKDFEGVTFPTIGKLYGVRIIADPDNTGTVALAGSSTGRLPAVTLDADAEVTLKLDAAGLTVSAQTMTFTFSAAGDKVTVEFLAEAA